ncbi:MAG: ADP-ribosylglycohydrolase family protein [Coprothermobacterota bacterium]|nr:ADP-ribosylglycohydrolase family protein [Coprothermobacterota bacterium]
MYLRERFRGCLLGLATGDALGTTLEFQHPGSFEPIKDMVGGGQLRLKAGEWTDDTSMALCLAESLIERKEFDPKDQMERYLRWMLEGYLGSNGRCVDIGLTTQEALSQFRESGNPFCGSADLHSAGNGSLMRLAPVPLFFEQKPEEAIAMAADSSRTTHGAVDALDACRYAAGLIVGALQSRSKEVILSPGFCPVLDLWQRTPLAPAIAEIAAGSFRRKAPPEIKASGYVVETLEAALWAFEQTLDFHDGVLLAVNLGNDADTVGAVFGQIAGAYYGERGIPKEWWSKLALVEKITEYADRFMELSGQYPSTAKC